MARPKKERTAPTQSVRMLPDDWEALDRKAKSLGFRGRAELLRAIANGQVVNQADRRTILLGELAPG